MDPDSSRLPPAIGRADGDRTATCPDGGWYKHDYMGPDGVAPRIALLQCIQETVPGSENEVLGRTIDDTSRAPFVFIIARVFGGVIEVEPDVQLPGRCRRGLCRWACPLRSIRVLSRRNRFRPCALL